MSVLATAMREEYLSLSGDGVDDAGYEADPFTPVTMGFTGNGFTSSSVILDDVLPWNIVIFVLGGGGGGGGTA